MPHIRHGGFAMIDVLVALLLLAVTLTGACATLVQTMRATHQALVATRSVDLAADLTEELLDVTSRAQADAVLIAWRNRVAVVLPVAEMDPREFASLTAAYELMESPPYRYELTLRWRIARTREIRELSLPVTTALEPLVP